MNTNISSPARALHAADMEGSIEIASGIYLQSQESVIADQASWGDEDGAKNIDFATAPYWLTTDNGAGPIPVSGEDDSDLIEALENA